ncbi:Os08g0528300 [Oryza sativa Japonica Group]|uniref:Os08g0528300 protein n=2 Tax=Oryza sativa subsp. japonica TaxID=39947 RepID=Q6ZIC1_ORYSJ|nr:hypothetical protein [Oryza sativa Japonica Group]BAT06366.1 Os08g0528300 [Oryza sativa Japonica Group]
MERASSAAEMKPLSSRSKGLNASTSSTSLHLSPLSSLQAQRGGSGARRLAGMELHNLGPTTANSSPSWRFGRGGSGPLGPPRRVSPLPLLLFRGVLCHCTQSPRKRRWRRDGDEGDDEKERIQPAITTVRGAAGGVGAGGPRSCRSSPTTANRCPN